MTLGHIRTWWPRPMAHPLEVEIFKWEEGTIVDVEIPARLHKSISSFVTGPTVHVGVCASWRSTPPRRRGNLIFAYDFFERSEVVDADGGSFYLMVDVWHCGNYTKNDIGPYKSLLEYGGQDLVWNHWPNHLWEPDESTVADGNIVMEPFELGKFDESTLNHVKIVVYRVADDKIVATGD
ncbi:hypothetical protein A2U01_0004297 [Trifolium medium]|uniref:Uncharacterized protein n=1 Tax=Trifolium medium TaxID=97028 RepID=A0A392M8N7_9FABA|nr:hypothetical protein [Trifolium medium]